MKKYLFFSWTCLLIAALLVHRTVAAEPIEVEMDFEYLQLGQFPSAGGLMPLLLRGGEAEQMSDAIFASIEKLGGGFLSPTFKGSDQIKPDNKWETDEFLLSAMLLEQYNQAAHQALRLNAAFVHRLAFSGRYSIANSKIRLLLDINISRSPVGAPTKITVISPAEYQRRFFSDLFRKALCQELRGCAP